MTPPSARILSAGDIAESVPCRYHVLAYYLKANSIEPDTVIGRWRGFREDRAKEIIEAIRRRRPAPPPRRAG